MCVSKVCKGQRARTHTYTDTHSVHILRKAGHKMVAYMTQPIQRGKKKEEKHPFSVSHALLCTTIIIQIWYRSWYNWGSVFPTSDHMHLIM